jgi:hypothetical protein
MNYGLRKAVVAHALIENRGEKVTGSEFSLSAFASDRCGDAVAMHASRPATSFYSPMTLLNRLVRLTTSFVSLIITD